MHSSLSHTQRVHQVSSKSVHNFLGYHAIYNFWPDLSMVKNHFKILVVGSGSGSSPKSNQFVLVTHPTCPPNFIRIRLHLFEISCTKTGKHIDKPVGVNGSPSMETIRYRAKWMSYSGYGITLRLCISNLIQFHLLITTRYPFE